MQTEAVKRKGTGRDWAAPIPLHHIVAVIRQEPGTSTTSSF